MAEPWLIHTVVFDLDDTLYPERDYVLSGFKAVDEWLVADHAITGFYDHAVTLFTAGRRGKIFDEALLALGCTPSAALVQQLVAAYRSHRPDLSLFPDADAALEWAGKRFNLGLITDGYREVQVRKIEALGLETRIPCRIVTDALGREFWKPHPEAYRRVMAHYGGEASGYVYVADNPRKDFIAAKALGWKTMRFRRTGREHADYEPNAAEAADVDIASLVEIPDFFMPKESAHGR
jgi:putative hydrolase of the HAD superfamily